MDEVGLRSVAAQLGVYELSDDASSVIYIGSAGARSLFGLKGELENWQGSASFFRLEVTTAYRTRQRELLMAHYADFGVYPSLNSAAETRGLGRLSP
jgi:hypothetical protein